MLPLILAGRLAAKVKPLQKQYRVFYFFSFYHIGGAEKVHAQVAQATGGAGSIIYFTRRSANDLLKQSFIDSGAEIRDISRYTDNKWLYPLNIICRGLITGYINRQAIPPVVFNGQNNFGYKISPWISKRIMQIELIHSLNTFSYIRIPFLPFITRTIMISRKRIDDHIALYKQKEIPEHYISRILYIGNAVELPQTVLPKSDTEFVVLYAGRGGEEKRLHLVAEIARKVTGIDPRIRFEIMGDVSGILKASDNPAIRFYGNVSGRTSIDSIYARASVLLLTSETEGFPMVIIEAMGHGTVILSTGVGDIPRHVINNENGYIFTDHTDEAAIVREGTELILKIANDRSLFNRMSGNNIRYARSEFSLEAFNRLYQDAFNQKHQDVFNHPHKDVFNQENNQV